MKQRGIFPGKDAAFNTYANNSAEYLVKNKARLRVDDDAMKALGDLLTEWNTEFPQSQDKNLRTTTIVQNKDELRVQLEAGFRLIFGDIPQSVLITADRNALNLKKRDANLTPVGVMAKAPGIEMESIVHLLHELRFLNPLEPETQSMPDGQKITLESFTGAAGLKESAISFGNAKTVTRFLKRLPYTADEVGQTAYYRACYINSRGEQGPWSEMFEVVIA